MKTKTIRSSILCLGALLFTASLLYGQGFSKYREFSLGTSLATVLKHTDQKLADVNVTHGDSPLFQELTWWPPSLPGNAYRSNSVEQMLFSFYNEKLYKITVTYEQTSTEGLTTEDIVKFISAKYGPPTIIAPDLDSAVNERDEMKPKSIAAWDDSQFSLDLVRSSFTDRYGLVICSKRDSAEAEIALANAVKLDKQDGPKRQAERLKKEANDLETARQKNQKTFRP
jgi:hypothetical protein